MHTLRRASAAGHCANAAAGTAGRVYPRSIARARHDRAATVRYRKCTMMGLLTARDVTVSRAALADQSQLSSSGCRLCVEHNSRLARAVVSVLGRGEECLGAVHDLLHLLA